MGRLRSLQLGSPDATSARGSPHAISGARIEAIHRNREFLAAYRDARAGWIAGVLIPFPRFPLSPTGSDASCTFQLES